MNIFSLITILLIAISCKGQHKEASNSSKQDEILEKYLKNGAWNHHYVTKEWDEWIDKGIQEDSTIAYLWQQKALPFWKQKKYQLAIKYYNKAVHLDRKKWLSRFAFLKCIFAKDYRGALEDFKAYKEEFGSTFEQDHAIEFYMGLCYLQLNQFEQAYHILKTNVEEQEKQYGKGWIHYLDRYYLAIASYELNKYVEANLQFEMVLKEYPKFSDAQYHKAICLNYLDKKEAAKDLMAIGKANFEKGYSFNEDSNSYENYPYQITWQWNHIQSIMD